MVAEIKEVKIRRFYIFYSLKSTYWLHSIFFDRVQDYGFEISID